MLPQLLHKISAGDVKALARTISLIENEQENYRQLLESLPANSETKIIGITGPPGAGKSTLVDGLIEQIIKEEKKVAVLCVDPSSPFNFGAVLGDRIRMSQWYTHPNVFIRSMATRGSLGGLSAKMIEVTDVVKAAGFDYIIVETVGVGQSEIEIAGLADVAVVVLVPEAGDEVQTMKAGLMEIADVFVVNKSDRPDADAFIKNLRLMLAPAFSKKTEEVFIVKTVASEKNGIEDLYKKIQQKLSSLKASGKKYLLLAEKAYQLIQKEKMKTISKDKLMQEIIEQSSEGFNLYAFVQQKL